MVFIEAIIVVVIALTAFIFGAWCMLDLLNDKEDEEIITFVRETVGKHKDK